jgi:hypothetical protein
MRQKVGSDIAEIFDPEDAFVYAVADPLPRAYFARAVSVAAAGLSSRDFFAEVGRRGLDRTALVNGASASSGFAPEATPDSRIARVRQPTDGYDIDVTAPAGGLLVLNVFPVRFWRAEVDGRDAPIVAVNGFQMGVQVPAGATRVRFVYERPTLTSALSASIAKLL